MRLPRLLDGGLNEIARLHPSRLSVTETLTPLSTAEMILPEGEPVVQVRQFVELYGQNGSFGIFRVAAVRTDWQSQQVVSLEHGAVTLEDSLGPEEYTGAGSMQVMINDVLSWQPRVYWAIGAVETDHAFSYNTGNQLGLQALLDFVEMVHGYALTFDQSSTPWKINMVKLPEEAGSECRLSRNVAAAGMTLDEAELCTRVTHAKLPGGYLDGQTVDVWGVIARPLDAPDDATEEQVLALAQEYLEDRKNPTVSVEIDGMELAALTGESLDRFRVGDLCRVALPEYETELLERIISINRPDVLGAPEQVKITLATQLRTAGSNLVGLTKTVDRNRRDANAKYKYIREELDKLVLEAPSIELIARVNEIEETLDDQILHMNEVMIRLDGAEAELLLKASQESYSKLEASLREAEIAIDGANAQIALKASQTSVDSLGERVSAAEIAIDGAKSEIALKADLVRVEALETIISGLVRVDELSAQVVRVVGESHFGRLSADAISASGSVSAQNVTAGYMTADTVRAAGLYADGNAVSPSTLSMGGLVSATMFAPAAIDLSHSHAVSVGADGTVTLGEVSAEGGNFKIADTKVYKDGVSAAFNSVTLSSPGWINGTNLVSASNGQSFRVELPSFQTSGGTSFNAQHKTTVFFSTLSIPSPLAQVEVDASGVYSSGYNAGSGAGYNNGYAAGKDAYQPTYIQRTGVDTVNRTVTVKAANGHQDLLTGQVIPAGEIFDAGYYAGWADAVSLVGRVDNVIYTPSATPGAQEAKFTVTVGGEISSLSNTAPNTFHANGRAYAYINGSSVKSTTFYKTQTINVGQ